VRDAPDSRYSTGVVDFDSSLCKFGCKHDGVVRNTVVTKN